MGLWCLGFGFWGLGLGLGAFGVVRSLGHEAQGLSLVLLHCGLWYRGGNSASVLGSHKPAIYPTP